LQSGCLPDEVLDARVEAIHLFLGQSLLAQVEPEQLDSQFASGDSLLYLARFFIGRLESGDGQERLRCLGLFRQGLLQVRDGFFVSAGGEVGTNSGSASE